MEGKFHLICVHFEESWKSGGRPDVTEFMDRVPDDERSDLLRELIQIELWWRRSETPAPNLIEVQSRFPNDASLVEKAFEHFQQRLYAEDANKQIPDAIETVLENMPIDPAEQPTRLSGKDENAPASGDRVRYFGEYELLEEIARGGMGVVFKARQVKLNRIVALKMILSGELAGEEEVQRFKKEAEAAANLDHPGIVPIFETGEHQGQHYFSMGFVSGQSLASCIKSGPLSPNEAAEIVKKVAEAVAYAHAMGVIHRDLKPGNVLLDAKGEPKVADFGLAKQVESDSDLTRTGVVMGTPSYMPPEQASGKIEEVDPRSDVYSLGAILYCALTGRPPFQSANPLDTLRQVLEREPFSTDSLNTAVPKDLNTICLKCLQKPKHLRYGSAQELADELTRFLRGEPIIARPVSRPERLWRWSRRNPVIASLVAISLTLATAIMIASPLIAFQQNRLRNQAQEQVTRLELERGLMLCRNNEVHEGVLWLEKSLTTCPRTSQDLNEAIRKNLANWLPAVHSRKRWLPSSSQFDEVAIVSWNGRYLFYSTDGRTFAVHDTENLNVLSPSIPIHSNVNDIELDRSGRIFAVADGAEVRLFDTTSWKEISAPLIHESAVLYVYLSATGKYLAAEDPYRNMFWVYDVPSRRLIRTIKLARNSNFDFDPTEDNFATFDGHTIQMFSCRDGRKFKSIPIPDADEDFSSNLYFTPDGRHLVTRGRTVRIWDTQTWKEVTPPIESSGRIHAVALGEENSLMATGDREGDVRLWRWDTGAAWRPTLSFPSWVAGVALSPDGQNLAAAPFTGNRIRIWNIPTGKVQWHDLPASVPVDELVFRDDDSLLVCDAEGVHLWSLSPTNSPVIQTELNTRCWSCSPRERRIATTTEKSLVLIDKASGVLIRQWPRDSDVPGIAMLSQDGSIVLEATFQGTVRFRDTDMGDLLDVPYQYPSGSATFAPLVLNSPTGQSVLVAVGSEARSWNWDKGQATGRTFSLPQRITHAAFSSNGSRIALASMSRVQVWDYETGRAVGNAWEPDLPGICGAVCFSDDGRHLFVALGETVYKWDVEKQVQVGTEMSHAYTITSIEISPDGSKLLSSSGDQTVRFWDCLSTAPLGVSLKHESEVQLARFSPDGRLVAAATDDGLVRVWDVATCLPVGPDLPHHNETIHSLHFESPNRLLTATYEGVIRNWRIISPISNTHGDVEKEIEFRAGCRLKDGVVQRLDWDDWESARQQIRINERD